MQAGVAAVPEIFTNGKLLEIPFFQRGYVWGEELWERLLEDIEFAANSDRPHFLGSVILKKGKVCDPFVYHDIVIDGQQRLTTLMIFMKALSLKRRQEDFFNSHFRFYGKEAYLKPSINDLDFFEEVINHAKAEKLPNPSSSKIIQAFNYFIERVDPQLDTNDILRNLRFIRIDLGEGEDEQEIFDTINSLGISLTTSELLKNYFFSRESIEDYQNLWVPIFEKDEETKEYWNKQIDGARGPMIEVFFDAFFQILIQDPKIGIKNEDKVDYLRRDRLSNSYKQVIKRYFNGEKDKVLKKLQEYAVRFREIFSPDECNRCIASEFGIERINVIIFGLKNTTLIPYILYVSKEAPTELSKICEVLESFIMRRMVVKESTRGYNNLFSSLIANGTLSAESLKSKLFYSSSGVSSVPSDDALLKAFLESKLTNLQSKGIIYLIESKLRPVNSSVSLLSFNSYSLEHLMPKKWRNNWKLKDMTEGSEKIRDSRLLTLGNLAIITPSLNASIRDAEWSIKKKGKKGKPGLEVCSQGILTISDFLKLTEWEEQNILDRSQWLFEKAKNIWAFP